MNYAKLKQDVNMLIQWIRSFIVFMPDFVSNTPADVSIEIDGETITHPNIAKQKKTLDDWRNSLSVSFSANEFTWSSTPNVVFPSILKSTNVETNRGDAYDPTAGIFTAPENGSYLFAATVSVSTLAGLKKDGSKPDFVTQKQWHEDMHFNINRYDANKPVNGDGVGGYKIGEIWIGEDGGLITDDARKKWFRKTGSATAIHELEKGEKVALEFVTWNEAEAGDKVMVSFNFSGTRLH